MALRKAPSSARRLSPHPIAVVATVIDGDDRAWNRPAT
jgi:hypothetical protein